MRKSLLLNTVVFLLAVLLFNTGGGCDQTQLTGDVIVPDRILTADEPVALQLTVPESLSGIYKVHWQLNPENAGEIIYGEALADRFSAEKLQQYFGIVEVDPDRYALFTAARPGHVEIEVYGYYKQTNPQPITVFELDISEG